MYSCVVVVCSVPRGSSDQSILPFLLLRLFRPSLCGGSNFGLLAALHPESFLFSEVALQRGGPMVRIAVRSDLNAYVPLVRERSVNERIADFELWRATEVKGELFGTA